MNKKQLLSGISIALIGIVLGCNAQKESGDWIAKVGSTPIFKSTLEEKVGQLSPEIKQQISTNDQARVNVITQLMNGLVSDTLILEDAKKVGYESNADYLAASDQLQKRLEDQKKQALITLYLRDNIDSKISVTDQEVIDIYNQNKDKFDAYEVRRASHILVKTRAEAEEIRRKIRQGQSFEDLAQQYSIDKATAARGGDVGEFSKAGSPQEFIDVAFALGKVGLVSNVFQSPLGFHIIKLTDIRLIEERKLQDVAQELKREIYIAKRNQAIRELITELKEKYPVTVKENKQEEKEEDTKQTAQAG